MQKMKRENTVTGQALNDERSSQFTRYKDNNVSIFCDLILCPKAAFYMFIAVTFLGLGGMNQLKVQTLIISCTIFDRKKLILS